MMNMRSYFQVPVFFTCALLAGCSGSVADGTGETNGGDGGNNGGGENGTNSKGGRSGAGNTAGNGVGGSGVVAGNGRGVAETPLRRLSRPEYAGTFAAAFGDLGVTADVSALPQDEVVAGFSTQTHDTLTDASLRKYVDLADVLGQAVAKQSTKFFSGCDRAKLGDATCLANALSPRLVSLFRRPLASNEASNMVKAIGTAAPGASTETLLAGLVTRALLAPDFLFKLEKGKEDAKEAGVFALSGSELAARLSYFLWRHPPDATLRKLADDGSLNDPKKLDAEIDRLLTDARSSPTVKAFHVEWLKLNKLQDRSKSTQTYPTFNEELRSSMLQESELFFDAIGRSPEGKWQDLFTSNQTFVNKSLSSLYGLAAGGNDFSKVILAADSKRAGILTQASFLTAHSHAENTQMIHRGLIVREQILCQTIPPPVNVDATKQVDRLITQPCAACHAPMEAIGTGFEAFDGIGKLKPNATPKGKIINLEGGDKEFSSVGDLSKILATQPETSACLSRQWFRFALGRSEESAVGESPDESSVKAVADAVKSDGRIRTLIKALVKSDAFLYRRELPASCK